MNCNFDINKLNETVALLHTESNYIQNKLLGEKEEKKRKAMIKQTRTINSITENILNFKNQLQSYREN
jgi:hypothetical protein